MDPNQNDASISPKQQVAERVRQATNVLVTVRSNPNVDELAATIGLTLMLNKLGKHATAVFSGAIPSTLEFLKPEETIETNTDSLRDFIVSLDKSKADKLRYKVEENVVKIFITPYRTSITQDDLEFSQGDFNVDVVLALGVTQREELDQAIVSHGRILHDATVVTVIAGQKESNLGAINWQDAAASSLSEMLVSISEAFQGGLIDSQIATAFLTGIVAETARFSNQKTSPKVMTMAAQLMAAGANQQLIANELQKDVPLPPKPEPLPAVEAPLADNNDGSLAIDHEDAKPAPLPLPEEQAKPEETPLPPLPMPPEPPKEPEPPQLGSILPPPPPPPQEDTSGQIHIDEEGNIMQAAEAQLSANQPLASRHKVIQPLPFADEAPATPETPAEPQAPLAFPMPEAPSAPEQPVQHSDNETLLDIEKSVHSPHVAQAENPDGDVENARNALADILNQQPFDPARDMSRADLNAQPLGVSDQPENSVLPPMPQPTDMSLPPIPPENDQDSAPPAPPIPPPLMPQQ